MLPRACGVFVVSALFLACGPSSTPRPDAGGVVACTPDEESYVAVVVQDVNGEPISGAEVTARNIGTNKLIRGTTNNEGITTSVGSSLGSGTVEVSARKETRVSEVKQVEFVCGECGCEFTPPNLTLQIAL